MFAVTRLQPAESRAALIDDERTHVSHHNPENTGCYTAVENRLMPHLDPELVRQLAGAAKDETVEVVFRLKPESGSITPEPAETERLTRELVTRAERSSGCRQHDVNVFRYLGSFAVSAPKLFVERLIEQPEIASAVANRQPDSGMIPPAAKKRATLQDVGGQAKRRPPRSSAKK